jgi:hypothetical protein
MGISLKGDIIVKASTNGCIRMRGVMGDELSMVTKTLGGRPGPKSIPRVIGGFAIHPKFAMITARRADA